MAIRTWLEEAPAPRSITLGWIAGMLMYFMPWGLEITIMIAAIMPGIYWGFAFIYNGNTQLLQETTILMILTYFYYGYCLQKVEFDPYCAPMAVFIHGVVDWLHHFRPLSPLFSSDHVEACCQHYPLICGCVDFAWAGTLALLIFVFGPPSP